MPSSWEKVKVGDSNMRLYVSAPVNQRPAGAVVVVQGQTGVNDMIQFSDLAAQNEEFSGLKARWENEKGIIQEIATVKAEIDRFRGEEAAAERNADFNRAAEIKFGKLPQVQQKAKAAEARLAESQDHGLTKALDHKLIEQSKPALERGELFIGEHDYVTWLGDFNYYGWNTQLMAAQGYVVAQIDPHGSVGYGQKFQDYVSGNWGKGEYEDLMKGVDYLIANHPYIDSTRMAALGRSYGGFMTNWICGHTDRFRCLSCHTVQDPAPSQATLNSFGQAFKNNGFRWDAVLAHGNADGDNCTNGFELSDQNGDGVLDANTKVERSNPGEPGCALEITNQTWTNLKILFRQ